MNGNQARKLCSELTIALALVTAAAHFATTYMPCMAQDIAPVSIVGHVIRLKYDAIRGSPPDVTAYRSNSFQLLAGPYSGLMGTYYRTKTGTNTSVTILQFTYMGFPLIRSNYSIYETPQSGLFSVTTFSQGNVFVTDTGKFDEVLFSHIASGGTNVTLSWLGGQPPYQVEATTNLTSGAWSLVQSVTNNSLVLPVARRPLFLRVHGQ